MFQNFNDGQEIIYQDLNKIPSRFQRLIFDKVIYEMIGRNNQGFFQDSISVSRISNTEVNIKSGLGFQFENISSSEPTMRPMILESNLSQIIPTANPTNDRIDIISAKATMIDGDTENRKFKDAFTDLIASESAVVEKKWSIEIVVTSGTPDVTPVAPANPAGYIQLCEILVEAANGIVAEANVTDKRNLLPLAGFSGATGSNEYDAVVGDTSILGVSHETLKAALDDPAILAGSKILVTRDELIGTIPVVAKNDIQIVFKTGVSFTDNGAGIGIDINANGVIVQNARLVNFTSGINIQSGSLYNIIERVRFNNCTDAVSGLVGKNILQSSIEE